jgi:hypothetical protein
MAELLAEVVRAIVANINANGIDNGQVRDTNIVTCVLRIKLVLSFIKANRFYSCQFKCVVIGMSVRQRLARTSINCLRFVGVGYAMGSAVPVFQLLDVCVYSDGTGVDMHD